MGIWSWITGADTVEPTAITTLGQWRKIVQDGPLPVILEVWSDTCPPCRRMVPVLQKVATRYAGKVHVVTVGTGADPTLLRHLRVRATPTLVIYRSGEELGRMTGFRPVAWFEQMIAAELTS